MPDINFIENTDPREVGVGFTDYMYIQRFKDGEWYSADIMPYGECLRPVQTTGLRFGLTALETVRVTLDKDGHLCVFRADAHIKQLLEKVYEKGLPDFDSEQLLYVLKELVKIDRRFVTEDTVLFATLMLTATDAGIEPHPVTRAELTITLETAPKSDMSEKRATDGLLILDSTYKRYAVSMGGYDLFFRMNDKVIAPEGGGVTKDSILKLVHDWGIEVETGYISMDEAVKAYAEGQLAEVFCADVRGVIIAVTALEYKDKIMELPVGKLSRKLFDAICHAERGTFPAHSDWTVRL